MVVLDEEAKLRRVLLSSTHTKELVQMLQLM